MTYGEWSPSQFATRGLIIIFHASAVIRAVCPLIVGKRTISEDWGGIKLGNANHERDSERSRRTSVKGETLVTSFPRTPIKPIRRKPQRTLLGRMGADLLEVQTRSFRTW